MPIIDDCRKLISSTPQVRIGHCYREANSCADFLTKMGSAQIREFILFNDLPVDLEDLISLDAVGMYHNRLLSELSFSP